MLKFLGNGRNWVVFIYFISGRGTPDLHLDQVLSGVDTASTYSTAIVTKSYV